MSHQPTIDLLITVRRERSADYFQYLTAHRELRVRLVTHHGETRDLLRQRRFDVVVLDNAIDGTFEFVAELRHNYPRILIVLVDEDADFAMPGQADDVSTDPMRDDDLYKRIHRLMSDRQLDTLRADTLPPIREFAKNLRVAVGEYGKQEAAIAACRRLGFDYAGFYRVESLNPLKIVLKVQDGPPPLQAAAPRQAAAGDILTQVVQTGRSVTLKPDDEPNYPLIKRGRLKEGACILIGTSPRYGVLLVGTVETAPPRENILMVELIGSQLAAAVSRGG